MNTQNIKQAVAEAAKHYGADAFEIEINTEESAAAEALKDEISTVSYSRGSTMTVRCVVGGKSGYASSELLTAQAAAELVEQACANAEAVDEADTMELFGGSEHYTPVSDRAEDLPSAEEMKENTLKLQRMAYAASDKIVDGTQSVTAGLRIGTALINSMGLDLSYECSLVYHGVAAAVKDGEEAADEYRMVPMEKEDAQTTVDKAVSGALSKLGADTVDSGKYHVILDKGTVRSLLSTFSTVFSARSAYLKTTLLAGKEGQAVASPCVTLTDDPFYPTKFSHCPYDGEGVAAYAKNLIEGGVLKTLLYNRMYAKLLGKETTGNAASAKAIEPKGLYIAPGDLSETALLERLGTGLYITGLNGLHAGANTQSGDFSLQAEGFFVEGGKKVRPVKNFTIADNFFSLLKKIDAVADTVEFGTGSSYGAPEVLVTDISVSGK